MELFFGWNHSKLQLDSASVEKAEAAARCYGDTQTTAFPAGLWGCPAAVTQVLAFVRSLDNHTDKKKVLGLDSDLFLCSFPNFLYIPVNSSVHDKIFFFPFLITIFSSVLFHPKIWQSEISNASKFCSLLRVYSLVEVMENLRTY